MGTRIHKVVILISLLSLLFSGIAAARKLPGEGLESPEPRPDGDILSPVETPIPGEEYIIFLPSVSLTVPAVPGMTVSDFAVTGSYTVVGGTHDRVWAEIELRDQYGDLVTGLNAEDFELTEALFSPEGALLEERAITFDNSSENMHFSSDGFWERTVTDEQLDIVFVYDRSLSMEEEIADFQKQLHDFVDRLEKKQVDFRIGFVSFAIGHLWHEIEDLRGVMESAEIREFIDEKMADFPSGEGYPTTAYEALLRAAQLDFRPSARKVLVVITDTVPHTVYGNFWLINVTQTVATRSSAEIFFEDRDFEIYYSQPDACEPVPCDEEPCNPEPCDPDPDQIQHLQDYTTDYTNPRAGCLKLEDGSWDCGFNSIATKISWPFQQQEIPLTGGRLADSRYFFAWMSGIELPWGIQDHLMRVTIRTPDPHLPGSYLEASCEYTPDHMKTAAVVLNVTDEAGNPIPDDADIYLDYLMGDRKVIIYGPGVPQNGQKVFDDVLVGDYSVRIYRSVNPTFFPGVHELEYSFKGRIKVPEGGLQANVQTEISFRESDLAMARGLLQDLDDWRVAGDPFGDYVQDAEAWLVELEEDGLTMEEAAALKRFYITLSGYANMTEYAQLQSSGAIEDVQWMVQDFRDIFEQVDALRGDTLDSWEEELAGALLSIIYNFFTYGEFEALKTAIVKALEQLATYVANEIAEEIRDHIMAQIPAGPYKPFIQILINISIDADFEDWEAVVTAFQQVLEDEILEELLATLADDFIESLFADLDLDSSLEEAIADMIENMLAAFVGSGFDYLDQALETFAQDVGPYVLQHGHYPVKQAVNEVFDQLEAQLPAGDVRDFLLGMTRDLALQAIPTAKKGQLNYDIDSDALVNILVKHAVYNVVLRDYYVEEAHAGMQAALARAKQYHLEGEEAYEQENGLFEDFGDYGGIVNNLQGSAWNALSVQDDIESWANVLEGLTTILDALSSPLDVIAEVYPPLEDEAEAVHGLIATLDSAQIITRAIEFGLKLECLDNFTDQVEPLYLIMFPDPE